MATALSFYPRPPIDTGLGMHDSHLTGDNPPDIRQHARNLRRAGVTWYKLLVGGVNKVERARIYAQEGIMCIVRLYAERPHPRFQPNRDEVAQYVAAGAKYFEAGNEPNLLDETEGGINPEADAAQWIRASDTIKSAGGVPVVYACTPGGHMNHRTYTTRFLAEVRRLGRLDSFDRAVLGIHPRPLNNPPDAAVGTGNPPNTTTWNEWTWYRDTYRTALGWTIPMIATEHGYSGGGQENGEHPPMNALTWAEWNKELFNRFNPSHPKALPPEFLAATYWLEVNHGVWIHDGPFANNGREWIGDAPRQDDRAWGKALWTIQPNWNRAGATVPPPPPPDPEIPLPPPSGTINLPAWVTVNRVTVAPGQQYYKLQSAHWQDSNTSGGLHHIFIEEPHDPSKSFNVSNGSQSWNTPLDKPLNEPAGNFAMFAGNVYAAKMNGLPSDTVIGMTMPESQHVNYFLEYALVTQPIGVPVFDMTTRFIQLARAEFGTAFEDLRATLPKHPTLRFDPIDSRAMQYNCFHHTATAINTTWVRIAEAHVNERGFAGIGYHMGIRMGKLALLGNLDTQRAHVAGRNDEALGIAWMGNSDMRDVPLEDIDIMRRLVTKVLDPLYATDKANTWHGAMLPNYTACPGSAMRQIVPTLRIVPTPPPPPQWTPQDAAKAAYFMEEMARAMRGDTDARTRLIGALVNEPPRVGAHNVIVAVGLPPIYEERD